MLHTVLQDFLPENGKVFLQHYREVEVGGGTRESPFMPLGISPIADCLGGKFHPRFYPYPAKPKKSRLLSIR